MKFRSFVFGCCFFALALASVPLELHCTGECQQADPNSVMTIKQLMEAKMKEREECHLLGLCPAPGLKSMSALPCTDGKAGEYPCKNVDLLSFTPLSQLGTSGEGNDIWGWTDANQREIAIMGLTDGTSFIDVTQATLPVVLGFLPSAQPGQVIWRDIKVYKNFAYIVSEHKDHGMQVFDLTKLPTPEEAKAASKVIVLKEHALYKEFGSAHNIVINEETGFAYGVGTKTCNGGLHMVDIRTPLSPKFAGCYSEDGYCHDAQCVVWKGPDARYTGKEICFQFNEDSLTITDVTDKSNPVLLSRTSYNSVAYSHQGWLTEDQAHLVLDDELDEVENKNDGHTETYSWSVSDLHQPRLLGSFHSPATAIDHNQYIVGDLSYQANYEAGLRILNVSKIAEGVLTEAAFFDVRPETTSVQFFGSWSVYPFFKSGNIVVSSIERGFFVVRPRFGNNPFTYDKVVVKNDEEAQAQK